jgi:hypothetical protein
MKALIIGIKQADNTIMPLDVSEQGSRVHLALSASHKDQRKFRLEWYAMPHDSSKRPVKTGRSVFSHHEIQKADGSMAGLVLIRQGKQVILAKHNDARELVPICEVPIRHANPLGFALKTLAAIAYAGAVAAGVVYLLGVTSPGLEAIKLLRAVFKL